MFNDNLIQLKNEYMKSFDDIIYVDSDEDYEGFCKNKKINSKRYSLSKWLINTCKFDHITKSSLIEVINILLAKLNDKVSLKENQYIVNEISENLFILITELYDSGDDMEMWDDIINTITIISTSDLTEYPGLGAKNMFKFEDIIECLEKASNKN